MAIRTNEYNTWTFVRQKFEDNKRASGNHKSKEIQHNCKRKKDQNKKQNQKENKQKTNNDLQNNTQ